MTLQAQLITEREDGSVIVLAYENRLCSTPREAEQFRWDFERQYDVMPDQVWVVSVCGSAAMKLDIPLRSEA